MEHYVTVISAPSRRVVAVIQARTGSSRLPGKILRDLGGRPVLGWMVRAARAAEGVDDVVVATSRRPEDDVVATLAESLGARVVRGDEDDVLSRFLLAVDETGADAVVRLTADCPLADPALVAKAVALWRSDPTVDYVSSTLVRTLPRGLDVEVASSTALRAADARAEGYHRTHVTSYLYAGPGTFSTYGLVVQPAADDLRVTLDTPEDAALLDALVAALGDRPPAWRDVVAHLRAHPELVGLNAAVRQKALTEG